MKHLSLSMLRCSGRISRPQVLLVLCMMFALILEYRLILMPVHQRQLVLAHKETNLLQALKDVRQKILHWQSYRHSLYIAQERFALMLQIFPEQNKIPALLEDISNTGRASGLMFESFVPHPEVRHDFYSEVMIELIFVGYYESISLFLRRLAQMDRLVTLHDLEMVPQETSQFGLAGDPESPDVKSSQRIIEGRACQHSNCTQMRLRTKMMIKVYRQL